MAQEREGSSDKPNPTQIQKFLGGMDYPAGRQEILDKAKENDAPEDIMRALEELPDREYEGPNGIIKELY